LHNAWAPRKGAGMSGAVARVSEYRRGCRCEPARTLERGYAALIDTQSGRAVRAPNALKPKRPLDRASGGGSADIVLAEIQPRSPTNFDCWQVCIA